MFYSVNGESRDWQSLEWSVLDQSVGAVLIPAGGVALAYRGRGSVIQGAWFIPCDEVALGLQRLMEKRSYKLFLPSVTMGNVRLMPNKMDDLTSLSSSQKESRECSFMFFTATWLHPDIPDPNVSIEGYRTVRAEGGCTESGKQKRGGLAILVNNRWCNQPS